MLTLQRLPLIRILLAHIGGKVFFQEHPAPADSGGGNASHGGALPQRGGMQLQEDGCLLEIERAHGACAGCETYVIGSGLSPYEKSSGPVHCCVCQRCVVFRALAPAAFHGRLVY